MDGLRSSSAIYTNHQIDASSLILLAIVITLTVISSKNQGFVTIPSQNVSASTTLATTNHSVDSSISFDLGILWTSIPSFLFTLFAAYWGWIATAVCDRQPFIELTKPSGADASASVLLDYRFVPIYWRGWSAFRRSQATVGSTVLLALFPTYLIQPLSARLFAPQTVLLTNSVPLAFAARYYASRMGANMDWRPIMSAVAVTKPYNGGRIPWTDEQRAYRPFRAAAVTDGNARVKANTSASSTSGTITMTGKDRGCDFEQEFGVPSS
ncbi:hypothetical protein CTRI78_v006742 [Colletotrichum trifolii]|uniref:Uncharacterized protein n=1 Tax=Colletotrichum trifolii TaxID=5466 RepID=A0A4R8RBN9_COLTR|nr:hypothetical protein CTRI78_v006742 [Colletotrichum trifolii]